MTLQKVERANATTGKSATKEEDDEPVGGNPQAVGTESESGLYAELLAGAGCKLICVVDSYKRVVIYTRKMCE